MDYTELVKELRTTERICRDRMDGEVMLRAADAIEELQKRLCESIPKGDAEIIISEVAKPRWISVKERLPWDGDYYLTYCTDGRRKMIRGLKFQKVSQSWYLTGKQSYWRVSHWMPLHEPPEQTKEDEA